MKHIMLTITLLFSHIAALAGEENQKYWNVQDSPEHIYRVVWIGYYSKTDADKMVFNGLQPPPLGLYSPQTRAECRRSARVNVEGMYVNYYYIRPIAAIYSEDALAVLVADRDAGIIGDRNENGGYDFMRFICLPMDKIDDLDLVGTEYDSTEMESDEKKESKQHNERYAEGLEEHGYKPDPNELVLPDDDPRHSIRYDADRFFARFAKYGVTRTLKMPDIKKRGVPHWNNEKWGTRVFIFPLDQANE